MWATSAACSRWGRFRVYTEEAAGDNPDFVHEDAAVRAFAELMPGEGVAPQGEPSEGKINFRAERDGLFEVDRERLAAFNMLPDVMCATRHGMSVVRKGARLAGSPGHSAVAGAARSFSRP